MPVVVGFVPTPEGKAALRRALHECHLRATSLIVVSAEHSSEPAPSTDSAADEVRAGCAELGLPEPETQIRHNRNAYEPADDVLSVAEETSAELIVIGLRRRTAVGKLILGGSAQRILLDASCPVLAVKVDRAFGHPSSDAASGADPMAEPMIDRLAEPMVDGAAEPVVEGAAEPVVEGVAEPVSGQEAR